MGGKENVPKGTFDPMTMIYDEGKFSVEKNSGGLAFYKPNLKLRISESVTELFQDELLVYLQTYYSYDFKFPVQGEKDVAVFPIFTKVNWDNLKTHPLFVDPYSFHFNLTKEMDSKGQVWDQYIYLEIPLIEEWTAECDFTYRLFGIPITDQLSFKLTNVTLHMQISLTATSWGHLRPQVHKLKLDLGKSNVYSLNGFHQWFIR